MRHKFIILALGLGFLASSCNDLDLVPLSEASTENWYSSEEELLMLPMNSIKSDIGIK